MCRGGNVNSGKLGAVIIEILKRAEAGLTRTQLVKICFLIDYQAVKELGRPITGIDYEMYYYGPYSPRIIETANQLERENQVTKDTGISLAGELYYVYRLAAGKEPEEGTALLSNREIELIEKVIQTYGSCSLRRLLDFVYGLPEVKNTPFGQKISLH